MRYRLNRSGGKGDKPRPVDKKKYDETWIRCFGKECPDCKGSTCLHNPKGEEEDQLSPTCDGCCPTCNGIGKVDRK